MSLLQNPEQFRLLKQDPSLASGAVTETLRFRSPVQAVRRVTTKAVRFGGKEIGKGQIIIAWIGSANHDETKFVDPERFEIRRNAFSNSSQSYHPHLAFGPGNPLLLRCSSGRFGSTSCSKGNPLKAAGSYL